ncbi:omega-hydroxypalmitate O-feruloyl transferase [Dorcoceras hygrometricum]|uniref:Omega-hydroxypalmitate O-feruloyl transferase n=1 Tax=Dorcoceras hygrometricum TaxID=472368 RepID=A0A2Z7C0D7_9LAMI|nr:omega-hydroxypalmitate O-feruloyl transferase [Dorcoceras hygrometricum]
MATILPNSAMQDLKVIFQESMLVFPAQESTGKKSIFLSNIDQILNYNVPTANFFSSNPKFPPESVAQRLKIALEKVLVLFDFMAGRLKLNQESGRLEIECNSAGAGFVVASSECSLEEIGDLGRPNLGFQQLAVHSLKNLVPDSPDDQPLCIFQITSFKCGGFAIGMSVNHILHDGISAKTFKDILASQAFEEDKPFPFTPCIDRRLLAARSPPTVEYPHPEFFKPQLPDSGPPAFDCKRETLDYIILKFTPNDINYLKQEASKDTTKKISSFDVVAALMWRCKALSYMQEDHKEKPDRVSTLLNVVDLRSRLNNPPLPQPYCGNAVLVASSSAKCADIEHGPFSILVEMVSTAPASVTSEYARSAIDWLEVHKGLPCGEYMVSSWLRLGFDQVEYPWGKPLYSCPVVSHRKDICWVFPDRHGINALVSLPPPEMEKFKFYFQSFFI